jgi:predicted nuclease of restriction endonuclease-like (RecB) superfamily
MEIKSSSKKVQKALPIEVENLSAGLLIDIRRIIENSRKAIATAINSNLVALYWTIGSRIRKDILLERRAGYGEKIVHAVSAQLTMDYGNGFSMQNIRHMLRAAEVFPDEKIVSALRRQFTWTHLKTLIYIDDPLKRDFYVEMCRIERWDTRTLSRKISGMLYERTALSRKPEKVIKNELAALRDDDRITTDLVLRDPYLLDFLGLKGAYSEKDLETAILNDLEKFLLELGTDFSFIGRQKRLSIGKSDYYLDLLFFHRRLKRLVAIELKIGKFEAAHKGQMELYLKYLDKYERRGDENAPLGIILCLEKDNEEIELLELWKDSIHVAEYMIGLPPEDLLRKKLHLAAETARRMQERRRIEGRGKTVKSIENRNLLPDEGRSGKTRSFGGKK